jgi:hypothetical protein
MTEKEKKTLREAILIMERLLDEGQGDLFDDTLSTQRRLPRFKKPTKQEVTDYFVEQGYTAWRGAEMWEYYEGLNWCNSKGKAIRSWKLTARSVWMTPEHLLKKHNGFAL